jgi:hypothetical protein
MWITFKAGTATFKLSAHFLIIENEGEEAP